MMPSKDDPAIQNVIKTKMVSWYMFLNEIFGVLGFGLGLGALGTQSSQFYAIISLAFLATMYIPEARKRRHLIKLLREENHPSLYLISIFRGGATYIFGLSFLVLIAIGVLESHTTISTLIKNAT